MTLIMALDPGNEHTALVIYNTETRLPEYAVLDQNDLILDVVYDNAQRSDITALYIEMIASYGMAVGRTVFDTCVWIGRFAEAWIIHNTTDAHMVYRRDVKLHLCNTARAKDANVKQALHDRYGGTRSTAVGTKTNPGPCYGFRADMWQALAVAITAAETMPEGATCHTSTS